MKLRGFSLPVEHFSATSLSKAAACPEAWRRRYLLKQYDRTFPGMFLGSVDHAMAAENLRQKIETGQDLDLSWVQARYKSVWNETEKEEKDGVEWEDTDPAALQATGLKMATAYHTVCAPDIQPIRVEERFEVVVEGVDRPVIGYADVVTNEKIIERKTSKSKVTKAKPNWRFQSRVYQIASDLPTSVHVITSQAEPKIYTGETEPGLFIGKGNPDTVVALIQQIAYRLNDMYERYGADNPWPTEGLFHPWMCDRCPAKNNGCPAWIVGN